MSLFHRLEIRFRAIEPPIWRRFALSVEARLADLHLAIRDLGWEGHGGWEMMTPEGRFLAGFDPAAQSEPGPEEERRLGEILRRAGDRLLYVYDLDDRFVHEVRHEGLMVGPEGYWRMLVDGARAFPPEGCGGPAAYRRLVRSRERAAPESGTGPVPGLDPWHPEGFDLARESARFDRDWSERLPLELVRSLLEALFGPRPGTGRAPESRLPARPAVPVLDLAAPP